MLVTKPEYFDRFRCAAGACPDSCCKEWEVQVDEASARYYRSLPGALGHRLREVLHTRDGETVMEITGGRCPMWRADGLCRIQAELGEEALCATCREFPRLSHDYGDFLERDLELSCPEAAKWILGAGPGGLVTEEIPGGTEPEYDRQAMTVLKSAREAMLALLSDTAVPVGQALALVLLRGCQAQSELDGTEAEPFSAEDALETARELAVPGDGEEMLDFFLSLEILTPQWEAMLRCPSPGPWDARSPALARYLLRRYTLQAVSDYDLYSRVKLAVIACLLVKSLGGDFLRTAQLFSKEIENDADNVDAILDAAYSHPAFTDAKLLGMLLVGS